MYKIYDYVGKFRLFFGGGGGAPEICDPKNKILYRRGGLLKFWNSEII